jgi:transposase
LDAAIEAENSEAADDLLSLKMLPRRWVAERTLVWITRHRRIIRDYEHRPPATRPAFTEP